VIDAIASIAYISDTGIGATGTGGAVIVYDANSNRARRFADVSTQSEAPAAVISINGTAYSGINAPTDGIALSADSQTLYWCPLRGYNLYSLPTSMLANFSVSSAQLSSQVRRWGTKMSQSDGMAIDQYGVLYFGLLSLNGVARWDTNTADLSTQAIITQNNSTMCWVDTFGFDNNGGLIYSTNNLQLYFVRQMDISGASGANFRLWRVPIGANSYLAAQRAIPIPPSPSCTDTTTGDCSASQTAVHWILGLLVGVIVSTVVALIARWYLKRPSPSSSYHEMT